MILFFAVQHCHIARRLGRIRHCVRDVSGIKHSRMLPVLSVPQAFLPRKKVKHQYQPYGTAQSHQVVCGEWIKRIFGWRCWMYCEYSSSAGSISAFDTATHKLRVLTIFVFLYALLCRFVLFPLPRFSVFDAAETLPRSQYLGVLFLGILPGSMYRQYFHPVSTGFTGTLSFGYGHVLHICICCLSWYLYLIHRST